MAFALEGTLKFNVVDNDTDQTETLPGTPVENDLIIYVLSSDNIVDSNTGGLCIQTVGYTDRTHTSGATNPGNEIGYKRMGATADTTAVFNQESTAREHNAGVIQNWSGADTSTIEDVTATKASAGSGLPDCASITPTTDGCLIVAIGQLDDDNAVADPLAAPTGYTNLDVHDNASVAPDNATSMISSKVLETAAAEDPAIYTTSGAADDAWMATTLAIRPAAGGGLGVPSIMLSAIRKAQVDPIRQM